MINELTNKTFLYKEYITNNETCCSIAKKIHSSQGTVHRKLKKFGIIKIKKEIHQNYINACVGKKYGLLTVIKLSNPPTNTHDKNAKYKVWMECLCDCGNTTTKPLSSLQYRDIISCGCLSHRTGKNNPNFIGHEELSGKFFNHIKRTASGGTNKRKRLCKEFNLTTKFLWGLYIKQNKKCVLSGLSLQFDSKKGLKNGNCSLDRIDSSKGYTEDNVQWVHKKINIMKNKYDQSEFIELCKLVSNTNDVHHQIK